MHRGAPFPPLKTFQLYKQVGFLPRTDFQRLHKILHKILCNLWKSTLKLKSFCVFVCYPFFIWLLCCSLISSFPSKLSFTFKTFFFSSFSIFSFLLIASPLFYLTLLVCGLSFLHSFSRWMAPLISFGEFRGSWANLDLLRLRFRLFWSK